jgi:hypothetical protein
MEKKPLTKGRGRMLKNETIIEAVDSEENYSSIDESPQDHVRQKSHSKQKLTFSNEYD